MREKSKPKKTTRERLERFYSGSSWFQLPKDFLRALPSWDVAIFLAYLINVAHTVRAEERNEGWFYCTIDRMNEELGVHVRKQTDLMRQLVQLKLVKTQRRGSPAKRYILINYKLVNKLVEDLPPRKTELDW